MSYTVSNMVSGSKKNYFDLDSTPSWIKRRHRSIERSRLNFHFIDTLDLLHHVDRKNLLENYNLLLKYFVTSYNIDLDVTEMWLLSVILDDETIINPSFEIDHLRFRMDEYKIAFPAVNMMLDYKYLFGEQEDNVDRKYVDLRIGRSNTKEDVIWLIENHWEDVEKYLAIPKRKSNSKKVRKAHGRNAIVYAYQAEYKQDHGNDPSAKQVQTMLDSIFPHDDDLDIATISKARNEFEPLVDWFAPLRHLRAHELQSSIPIFKMKYIAEPKPHLEFEKLKNTI